MSPSLAEYQALRTPSDIKVARGAEYDYHIRHNILGYLSSIKSEKDLAFGNDKKIIDVLEFLNPGQDTLPYLFILLAQIGVAQGKSKTGTNSIHHEDPLWNKLALFLCHFNPVEVRYAMREWRRILNAAFYVGASTTTSKAEPWLTLVARAILRVDPSAGTYTSTNLHFIHSCLERHAFRAATVILDKDIHSLPPKSITYPPGVFLCSDHYLSNHFMSQKLEFTDKIDIHDILEYYLLGAMAYIGLKDWSRALFYLEHVLCTPTAGVLNGSMLEAYKKWVLVSLLLHGKLVQLPKAANSTAMKNAKAVAKPYESLADAFKRTAEDKLRTEAVEARGIWIEDGNMGLVEQVIEHHKELFVSNLQNVYMAISVAELSVLLGTLPAETTAYLIFLISNGLLSAKLENEGQFRILRFLHSRTPVPQAMSEASLRNEIVARSDKIKTLADHVNEVDHRLSLTKEYIESVRRRRKMDDQFDEEAESMDVPGFNDRPVSEDEENVMADVG